MTRAQLTDRLDALEVRFAPIATAADAAQIAGQPELLARDTFAAAVSRFESDLADLLAACREHLTA